MMNAPATIGFIGLGNLGQAMAHRLIDRGFGVVAHDISASRMHRIAQAGGTTGSIANVVDCETVCVATPDESALLALIDNDEITDGSAVKRIVLHSTVLPTAARDLAGRLSAMGISLVEAAVSGGPTAAREGRLALFLGGEPDAIDSVREVLSAFGSRLFPLGPVGAGSAVKLANQLVMFAAVDALHEGLALTADFDVATSSALDAIGASTGDTWIGRNWSFFDGIVADYDSSSTAERDRPWRKDLREFIDATDAASLASPLAEHLVATVGDRIEAQARSNLEGRSS